MGSVHDCSVRFGSACSDRVVGGRDVEAAANPLQTAIACTVPMWFCTALRFGSVSEAKFGRISVTCGLIVAKYGDFLLKAKENKVAPFGRTAIAL